jgi:hypothetical protein
VNLDYEQKLESELRIVHRVRRGTSVSRLHTPAIYLSSMGYGERVVSYLVGRREDCDDREIHQGTHFKSEASCCTKARQALRIDPRRLMSKLLHVLNV